MLHTISAIFGPVFEIIVATSYLDGSLYNYCNSYYNSYWYEYYELDYDCDSSSLSDVAGLAIASCSFLIG